MTKKKEHKKKKKIQTRVIIHGGGAVKEYLGRSLGFIRPEEYTLILNDDKLKKRVYTYEAKTLADLVRSATEISNFRYVLAIQKVDGKEVYKKKLFISEPLDYMNFSDATGACLTSKSENYIELEEIK